MCQELRMTSMELEQSAAASNDVSNDAEAIEAQLPNVKRKFLELRQAVENYHAFLRTVDI